MDVPLTALDDFAATCVQRLPQFPKERAYFIGLSGELGTGKTTFVQALSRALDATDRVTSPTFILVRSYRVTHPVFLRLIHVDAYRLQPEDTDTIGFAESVADPKNLIVVEWPEHLPRGTPKPDLHFLFRVTGADTRDIIEIE